MTGVLLTEAHRRYNPLRKSWVLVPHIELNDPGKDNKKSHRLKNGRSMIQTVTCVQEINELKDKKILCTRTLLYLRMISQLGEALCRDIAEQVSAVAEEGNDELFQAQQATGICRVICFNPRHDLTLPQMTAEQIEKVVEAWKEVYAEAQQNPEINYCQIFENKGQAMGCSNPHPHGQVWMTNIIPEEPAIEHECLMEYESKHNKGLLEDYVEKELVYSKDEKSNRIVALNDSFTALVPFWATWPFEVMLVSRRKVNNIRQLSDKESKDFSSILLEVTLRYDNLFGCSFPYSMGLHQAFMMAKIPSSIYIYTFILHY